MIRNLPRKALVLDPSKGDLQALVDAVEEASTGSVDQVATGRALRDEVDRDTEIDLVVVDLALGDGEREGLDVVRALRDRYPDLPVVVAADHGDVHKAHQAIEAGATDFLVRGEDLQERVCTVFDKIRPILSLVEKNRALHERNAMLAEDERARFAIVGRSDAITELLDRVERIAPIPRPVLVTGERGTGKELVARAIHFAAGGGDRPFVTVNCAAFAETVLESELFGHRKGSFTGAHADRRGKFELADGGTLFLDEIGNMSMPFQQKILRAVEYGTFTPVGGSSEVEVEVRVVAATNADLDERMRKGEFLRDLYDRLAFEVLHVPPLRERPDDIDVLAQHFLEEFVQEVPTFQGKTLAPSTVTLLKRHTFPGNVRELKNIIERAVYRDTTDVLDPEDIGLLATDPVDSTETTFKGRVESYERRLISDALEATGGNQKQAAKLLGLTYHQFRYYKQKYDLPARATG